MIRRRDWRSSSMSRSLFLRISGGASSKAVRTVSRSSSAVGLVVGQHHEAPAEDAGIAGQLAGGRVHQQGGHHDAVLLQDQPVVDHPGVHHVVHPLVHEALAHGHAAGQGGRGRPGAAAGTRPRPGAGCAPPGSPGSGPAGRGPSGCGRCRAPAPCSAGAPCGSSRPNPRRWPWPGGMDGPQCLPGWSRRPGGRRCPACGRCATSLPGMDRELSTSRSPSLHLQALHLPPQDPGQGAHLLPLGAGAQHHHLPGWEQGALPWRR